MATKLKYWREAATLIIAAKTSAPVCSYVGSKKFSFNYKILKLQRNTKAGFFPSAQVFPGGEIDRADSSPEWLDIFRDHCGIRGPADFGSMVSVAGPRPPMLARDDHQSPVPVDVTCRICAIRETFEESGILLLRESRGPDAGSRRDAGERRGVTPGRTVALSDEDRKRWRKLVYENAEQFLSLCKELRCFPDIWSLAEWSNWLTPSDMTKRRFDTMFYIACLDSMPDAFEDKSEIIESKWVTPLQSLQIFADAQTYVPPPQIYEFRRLLKLESFDELFEFCQQRAFKGTLRYMPVRCDLDDCVILLYPGDEDYPAEPVLETGKGPVDWRPGSAEDSFRPGRVTNRMVFRSQNDCHLVSSCPPACGHMAPATLYIPPSGYASSAKL